MAQARIDQRVNTASDREMLDIDREAVIAQREINRLAVELAAAKGVKAGVFRRAKTMGSDMKAYKNMVELRAMDEDDRNRLRENEDRWARVLGIVLYRAGTDDEPQGALWDAETLEAKTAQREALIMSDGMDSARTGSEASDNPHEPGSRDHQVWAEGFSEGTAQLGGKQVPVKASTAPKGRAAKPATAEAAAPKPRGRPKKVAADAAVH